MGAQLVSRGERLPVHEVATTSPLGGREGYPSAVACQPQPESHHPHSSPGRAPAAYRAQHSVWMQTCLHLAVAGRDCKATAGVLAMRGTAWIRGRPDALAGNAGML